MSNGATQFFNFHTGPFALIHLALEPIQFFLQRFLGAQGAVPTFDFWRPTVAACFQRIFGIERRTCGVQANLGLVLRLEQGQEGWLLCLRQHSRQQLQQGPAVCLSTVGFVKNPLRLQQKLQLG